MPKNLINQQGIIQIIVLLGIILLIMAFTILAFTSFNPFSKKATVMSDPAESETQSFSTKPTEDCPTGDPTDCDDDFEPSDVNDLVIEN